MIKIILKNLWNRRRANIWLFAELIIVTILSWVIIDDATVSLHDINMPLGYDPERIVNIEISTLPAKSKLYREEYADNEANTAAYHRLLEKASRLPMVESSCRVHMHINDNGISLEQQSIGNPAVDTLAKPFYSLMYPAGERVLSTYGFEATEDSPSVEELESRTYDMEDVIITETIDRAYWPDRRGIRGKRFVYVDGNGDTTYQNVVGILKDIRYQSTTRSGALAFFCYNPVGPRANRSFSIVLRLRDGVNTSDYIRDNIKIIDKELREGNYYVIDVRDQNTLIKSVEDSRGVTSKFYLNISLAILFLANLILGVTGCVWLQTGKRIREIGVLRSFGAQSRQIIGMLIGESVVMATIAFIIGDFVFFQYACSEGLSIGFSNNNISYDAQTWVSNFGQHFAIVSAIVYVIIIACVVTGTYFPAFHASRIKPVEALRDE